MVKMFKRSNWEAMAFIFISHLVKPSHPFFSRTDLITSENISVIEKILPLWGHKARAKQPEASLQGTIQKMRDSGYIDFLGEGQYKLTRAGFKRLKEYQDNEPLFNIIVESKRKL